MEQKSLVEEILELWVEMTGMDPNSKTFHFQWDDKFSLDNACIDLKEAFRLDDTGLTALLMLDGFADSFFADKTFSLQDLMDDSNSPVKLAQKGKKLKELLHHKDIQDAVTQFQTSMTAILDKLGAGPAPYEMLQNPVNIGYVRRDAFRSMETLYCYQFAQGKTTAKYLQPVNNIFLFWDIASVIRLGLTMPDCTFLGVVKDEVETASFFVLVAKNGENLTVFTDRPEWTHPLQKGMMKSRRPGKELADRIARHHFPYDKLDITYDYRGDAYVKQTSTTALAVRQEKLHVIGKLSDLYPDETLWLLMVLAMMDQKLYKQNYHLPQLSYCTEVLFEHSQLTDAAKSLAIPSQIKFELPVNTVQTLADDPQWKQYQGDSGEETAFGVVDYRRNQWLEEKYKDKVPQAVINNLILPNTHIMALRSGDTEVSLREKDEINALGYFDKKDFDAVYTSLETISGSEFGSLEELQADYRFLARYNEAKAINQMVKADFDKYQKEVKAWVRERIRSNLEFLIQDMVENWIKKCEDPSYSTQWSCATFAKIKKGSLYSYSTTWYHQGSGTTWANTRCVLTGKPVYCTGYYNAETQKDLLFLTGCKTADELPEWLQHWGFGRFYIGNPILQRIDPMLWVVEDLWAKLDFNSLFFVSKTAINRICKEKNLSPSNFVPIEAD